MIEYPVTLGIIFGASLGIIIGMLLSHLLRVKKDFAGRMKPESMGEWCPRCHASGTMRISQIVSICKECSMASIIGEKFQ